MKTPSTEDVRALLAAASKAIPVQMDPHCCTIRCGRIGAAADLDKSGTCVECGQGPTSSSPAELEALVRSRPELLIYLCESFLLMRTLLDSPAVMAAAHAAQSLKRKTNVI